MRQVIRTSLVLKVGVVNRAVIYWIPLLFMFYGAKDLAWFWPESFDLQQGIISIGIAVAFVLACEYFMFGFRVDIREDELIYRYRGFPFPRERRISKSNIKCARYEAAVRTDNKPWRFVEVCLDGSEMDEILRINLTAFSRSDVEAIPGLVTKR